MNDWHDRFVSFSVNMNGEGCMIVLCNYGICGQLSSFVLRSCGWRCACQNPECDGEPSIKSCTKYVGAAR